MSSKRGIELSSSQQIKKRRVSRTWVQWDKALEVSVELKNLRKYQLGITQLQFDHLQNQLYVIGCVKNKENKYIYPAVTSGDFHVPDSAYIKILKHLHISQMYKFCIWKYANNIFKTVPEHLESFFAEDELNEICVKEQKSEDGLNEICVKEEKSADVFEEELYESIETKIWKDVVERSVTKNTVIKINDTYTLQNVQWTVFQRKAARNTRNHFLYGFKEEYPMLSDVEFTEFNQNFVYQFLTALLKADVSGAIISNICCSCFGVSNIDFDMEEKVLLEDLSVKKEKTDVQMQQRTSITDFTYMEKENKAARIIQRAFRRVLQGKKNAVVTIEKWWLPYAIRGKVEREVFERRLSASVEMLEERTDKFKYKDFKKEIIQDFKEINNTKKKGYSYWLQIYCLVGLGCLIEYALTLSDVFDEKIMILFPWILLQLLTVKRLIKKVLFIQTILLITITCRLLNVVMQVDTVASRFFVYFIIVNAFRQYWLYGLIIAFIIRFALYSAWLEYFFLRPNEGFVFVYDIYSVVTIVACHRSGDPIKMLHKWMVGVLVFTIILAGIAATNIMVLITT